MAGLVGAAGLGLVGYGHDRGGRPLEGGVRAEIGPCQAVWGRRPLMVRSEFVI